MKKIISFITSIFIVLSNSGQTFAIDFIGTTDSSDYIETTNCSSGYSFDKIKAIWTWLQKSIKKSYTDEIASISDKAFLEEIGKQKMEIYNNIRAEIRNSTKTNPYSRCNTLNKKILINNFIPNIKTQITVYKNLLYEIKEFKKTWINPYILTTEETNNVERNILNIQKDINSYLRSNLDKVFLNDIKETGKWKFSLTFKDPYSNKISKLNFDIEDYTRLVSLSKNSQDNDFKINFSFDIEKTYKWTGVIYFNYRIIENDIYLTLKDIDIKIDWLKSIDAKSFEQAIAMISLFKWRTIHMNTVWANSIKTLWWSSINFANILNWMLDVFSKESLFTPYKKVGSSYGLTLKTKTLKDLYTKMWASYWDDYYLKAQKSFKYMMLNYSKSNWEVLISTQNPGTNFFVKYKDSKTFEVSYILEKNGTNFITNLKYWYFTLKISDKTATLDLVWKDDYLNLLFDWYGQKVVIKWDYNADKTDLRLFYNSKDIWYIKSNKLSESKYDYSYYTDLNISDEFKFFMDIKWKIELGKFDTAIPAWDIIEIDDIMKLSK